MAFKTVGNLDPHGGPLLRTIVIDDTITIEEMDCVKSVDQSNTALCTTGDLVMGFVEAILDKAGMGVTNDGLGSGFTGAYTTGATNVAALFIKSRVNVSKFSVYSGDPDDTIGANAGSDSLGYHTDIADEVTTDEDTAALTSAQLTIWGVDPADTGNQLLSIYESQMFGV